MRTFARFIITTALVALVAARGVAAQSPSDVWRTFAARLEVGAELNVRVDDGSRARAIFVGARDDAVLLVPKTRVPVPIQAVPYERIVLMERVKPGIGAARAVAIGVATGVGAFFATLAIILAVAGD